MIAEAEFMEKRQTLEQQAQRLKIASEVAKLKARMKLLENTREFNEKLDTATTFTVKVRHQCVKRVIQKEVVMMTEKK